MRILIIPEYGLYGGTLSFLNKLVKIHARNGIETAVLIPDEYKFPHVMNMFQEFGVRVYTKSNVRILPGFKLFPPLFDIICSLRAFFSFRPDLIVVSIGTPGDMSGVLFFPVPVVFVMHTYPREPMDFTESFCVKLANGPNKRFVTVSRFAAAAMSRWMGIPEDRIEVVYNSFNPPKHIKSDGCPIVLTIGHVDYHKNPETWLNVARQVVSRQPDVRFVWIGDGSHLEQMREMVRRLGETGRIELHGYSEQVARYYAETLVYFQPSHVESHGISVVEAMAYGLPCVTSDAGGLPESVVNGETGYTHAPDDVAGFVTSIIELLDNQTLREKMGAAGKDRAEKLFSEALQEEKILKIYSTLVHKTKS